MIFTLTAIAELKIISARVRGAVHEDFRREILSRTLKESLATGYHRILIDVRRTTFPPGRPDAQSIAMVGTMLTPGISRQTRMAFVYHLEEELRLCVGLPGGNRDLQVRCFRRREQAVRWLCRGRMLLLHLVPSLQFP